MTYTLTYLNRFYRDIGIRPIDNITPEVVGKLDRYAQVRAGETGVEPISSAAIAVAIIDMLFWREFTKSGKHWSYDGSSADPIPSDNPDIEKFDAYEAYEWNWKDIYSVAKSSGRVIFNHAEKTIFVDEYGFYCSG
jgi:hypothetical protein